MKRLIYTLLLAATFIFPWQSASAQEDNPLTAQDLLIDLVGEAIVEETTKRSEEVRKAKEILDAMRKAGTKKEQDQAEKDLDEAEDNYRDAQKKLDTARLDAFAEQCGKSPSQIQAMRNSGMGWGRIAKECGIHPSVAGKGKGKGKGKSKKKNKGKGKKK